MRKPQKAIQLTSYNELLGIDESVNPGTNQIVEVPLSELYPFKNHPFQVRDDEKMEETVESIRNYGVLNPGLVRPRAEGGYEVVAGHRRKRGCELAGKTILNEFISRIEVHERDKKRAKQAIQHIGIYFNHIGRFENELTQLAEPTEQEIRQMREEIEEARKEKNRAYHRNYSREYRARNLEKQREYDRIKAREYRAKKKAQAAAALSAP